MTKIIFDYFEDYFNLMYSLPKLGMFHTQKKNYFQGTEGILSELLTTVEYREGERERNVK